MLLNCAVLGLYFKWEIVCMRIKAKIIADVPNGNGRIYPKDVLISAFKDYEQKIKDGKALGTISPSSNPGVINLIDVSHMVTSYCTTSDGIMLDMKILDTPAGRILQQLMKQPERSAEFVINGFGDEDAEGNLTNVKIVSVNLIGMKGLGK